MKRLLLLSSFLLGQAFGATYIVEMERPLRSLELKAAVKSGLSIELFDRTSTDYFRRTYRIEAKDRSSIGKLLPVKLVEEVHEALHLSLVPKSGGPRLRPDELFKLQWGLHNEGQVIKKLIGNTKLVETVGKPGTDIRWARAIEKIEANLQREPVVAVIDMGIDFDHPDLKGRIFKNLAECDEKGEVTDLDEDKDNNGLKGDCMGWNFAGRSMFEARRPVDDNGHGTHVSGIIAAEANKIGTTGVSSKIRILPIKVTGRIDESAERRSVQPLTDRIAKGILYAANMGADVINLSLGWTRSMDTKYLNEALDYALKRGVVVVAAAGNNNNNAAIFPCAHYDVLCVGAVSVDGSLADFSNYGGEVDVLAPGDEIAGPIPLQAIPLQLNLQGYDVRSGTSQAAPHVSAIAALIRGTFPRLHRDEVVRRITDSADPGIPGKSLRGLVNLEGAFALGTAPSVKPIFKRFSVGLFDGPTGRFIYPLNVKNYGAEARDITVSVRSLSPAFKLEGSWSFQSIRPGEVLTVRMQGELVDLKAHNLVSFEVRVQGPELPEGVFQHEFRLARDVLRDPKLSKVSFEFQGAALPVGTFIEGQARNFINTVERHSQSTGLPEYYLSRFLKESGSFEVKFLRPEDGVLKEAERAMILPEARELLNVQKLDLNFDGEEDYLVRAIACSKDCETPGKAQRYIQYTLWKKDLTPLFGERSTWRFLPTLVNVNLRTQRFLKVKSKDFGEVLVPVFLENGVIPEEQQDRSSAFSLPDRSIARRIYHLLPEVNEAGEVHLQTVTLSTVAFLDAIRVKAGAAKSDEVQAVHLLSQSLSEERRGTVRVLLSVGKGYLRKNLVLDLNQSPEQAAFYGITQNLWGFEQQSSIDLTGKDDGDSFSGLVSRNRLTVIQDSSSKARTYDAATVEVPLATVASFRDGENEYTFFQTPSYLMLMRGNGSETKFSRLKINRFSFLPGALFNDTFYPVLAKSAHTFVPALYVDETDIQSNLISLTTYSDGELRSPLGTSAFIPPVCKAMNPVRLRASGEHSLALLCFEDKQWAMRFVPLNQ